MKNHFFQSLKGALVLLGLILFAGCFKDSAKQTYTITRPVLARLSDARNNIKMNAAIAITAPGKMYLYGNTIFLNEAGKGIHVIDNSNPAQPLNKYFIPIPGNYDLAVAGNTLYVDCFTDLLALNISNPDHVELSSFIKGVYPEKAYPNGFNIDTGYYVVDWVTKDTSINLSLNNNQNYWQNGGVIFLSGSSNLMAGNLNSSKSSSNGIAGSMSRLAIQNGWMYAVSNYLLNVIDISNPEKLSKTKSISLNAFTETIFPFKDKLFIGGQTGMNIYSVADPIKPVFLSTFSHASVCDPVIADDNYAYVTLHSNWSDCRGTLNEMDILNISNIQSPLLVRTYPLSHPKGLGKEGNTLMVCDDQSGLLIYDASNPEYIKLLQTIQIADAYDVICYHGIAYVSAKDGLYQYDFSKPEQTKLISKISIKQ